MLKLVLFVSSSISRVFSANIEDFNCYDCTGNEFEICETSNALKLDSLELCPSRLCVSIFEFDKNSVTRSCASNDDGLPKAGFGCLGKDNSICYDFCGVTGCNDRSFKDALKKARPQDSESFSLRVFDVIGKVAGFSMVIFAVFRIVLSVFEKYSGNQVFEKFSQFKLKRSEEKSG